ncbi:hypothetical protein [Psychrobacillus vulpis]|nr:hypothetical protein [Psychrobacillus vulpis]
MKKKNLLICLTLAFLLTLSFTPKASKFAEEEAPRPTSIDKSFF